MTEQQYILRKIYYTMTTNMTPTQVFDKYLVSLNNKVREYYVLITTFAPSVSSQALLEHFLDNDYGVQIYVLLTKYKSALIDGGDVTYVSSIYTVVINKLILACDDLIKNDGIDISGLINTLITLEAKHKK